MAFIEETRAEGHAVESICRVLRERLSGRRTILSGMEPTGATGGGSHAQRRLVEHKFRQLAWTIEDPGQGRPPRR